MDNVWHELNTTHKNGLKSLLASRDAAEAARNAFGWYEFSVGPEVAVADMNKHGQNGLLALNQGVQFALQLTGQPVPQMANLPSPQAPQVPQTPMSYAYEQPQVVIVPPLTPYNKEAFYGMENTSNNQALMDMVNSVQDQFNAYQQEVRQRELAQQEAAERQRGLAGLGAFFNMMGSINQGNDDTSPYSYMSKMLTMMPNTASRGGRLHRKNLYGGEDEPTGYLRKMKDASTGEIGNVTGLNDDGTYNVQYSNGVLPMALQAPGVTVLGNYNPRGMSPEEKEALMRIHRNLDAPVVRGELKDNQYNTLLPQWMIDQNADKYAERTAPGIGSLLNTGIIKPLELINPLNLLAACTPNKNTETGKGNSDTLSHLSEHNTVIVNPSEEQIMEHWNDVLNGNAYYQEESNMVEPKLVFRRPNESRTSTKSQELENLMYTGLDRLRNRVKYRTIPFDIPYGDQEITIKPKGDLFKRSISVNALDSLAKYAGITGTPIQDALGLAWQETKLGRIPFFNDSKIDGGYTATDLENSNFFKNFGSIPAEYLVRDFRYNGDLVFNGKRDDPIPLDVPPLQHALEYFNGYVSLND